MRVIIGRLGVVVGIGALVAGGVMFAPQAGAAPTPSTVCTSVNAGVLSGSITGNVTVPNTSYCTIVSATITGSVSVGTYSYVTIETSAIGKNVTVSTGAVFITYSQVGGNVTVGNFATLGIFGSDVHGNVSAGYNAFVFLGGDIIDGNLRTSSSYTVTLIDVGVAGNASFNDTLGTFSYCGGTVSVCSFYNGFFGRTTPHPTTNHPYKMSNVSITTTQQVAVFVLNYVTGNLTCSGNGEMVAFLDTVGGHASGQCATASVGGP